MALVADSGPVTSAEENQSQIALCSEPLLRRIIFISLTGLQAIDGLVSTLGLVSLGYDGWDSVTSQPSCLSSCKGAYWGNERAARFADSRHFCRGCN
jgi:hypothetical protein